MTATIGAARIETARHGGTGFRRRRDARDGRAIAFYIGRGGGNDAEGRILAGSAHATLAAEATT